MPEPAQDGMPEGTSLWMTVIQWTLLSVGFWLISGTALNFSSHPHWYIRGWDFPRTFTLVLAVGTFGVYVGLFWPERWWEWLFLLGLVGVMARQVHLIYPYTIIARKTVKRSKRPPGDASIKLVASNVLMESREFDKWLQVIRAEDPDLIIAVETDAQWDQHLAELEKTHPYSMRHPLDNYFGMVLFSRLKLIEPRFEFLVQEDIPSVHTWVELRSGDRIFLHGLHPRPPEPLRDQHSTPRDAELVMVGRNIGNEDDRPTIVTGDLNDVAWSSTTKLFLRLSGLLDPRMGRGFYNTYNANNPLFRFPLDHLFHSNHFKLIDLRRLEHVGSDHFPILGELSYEPEEKHEQPEPEEKPEDEKQAAEMIEKEVEAEKNGEEDGHLSEKVSAGNSGRKNST